MSVLILILIIFNIIGFISIGLVYLDIQKVISDVDEAQIKLFHLNRELSAIKGIYNRK